MTDPNAMPPDDRELEEFLARRSELSRRYREAEPERQAPPPLEPPILAQAQEELRRARSPLRRLLRWEHRFAAAAAILLVVTLAWLVQQQAPLTMREERAKVAMQSAPAPAPVLQAPPAAAEPAAKAPPPAADVAQKASADKPMRDELRRRAATPPQQVVTNSQVSTPDLPAAPPPPSIPAGKTEPAPVTADAMAAPVALPPPPPPAPAAVAPAESYAQAEAAPAAPAGSARAGAAASPDPCRSPQRAAAQAQAQPERGLDAATWLEQIRHLRDTPDLSAARAELACFSAVHPRDQIPQDLQPLRPPAH